MAAKYKLMDRGVKNLETGGCIPFDESNKDYQEYLEWLAEGNTPDPQFTQEELDEMAVRDHINAVTESIKAELISLYCIVIEMWNIGLKKNLWKASDLLDPSLKDKVDEIKVKLDELKIISG